MSQQHKLSCNIREHGLVRLNAQQVVAMSAGQNLPATILPIDAIPALPVDRMMQTDWLSFSRSKFSLRQCEKSAATIWISIPTLPSN
ncbi:MAG: hypothetical protein ACR2QJ_05480 [Geminicoccaceae bacterium]